MGNSYSDELIEECKRKNTYICGSDGKLCGIARELLPFPCHKCERNTFWKAEAVKNWEENNRE